MGPMLKTLCSLPLFRGLSEGEVLHQLEDLRGQRLPAPKGCVLIHEGQRTDRCGIVLSGLLEGQQVNEDGDLSVISTLEPGMMFGEILMFSDCPAPITLIAAQDSEILWLGPVDPSRADPRLIGNLFSLLAEEYWALHHKIRYCGIVSLRKRIFAFLTDRQVRTGERFYIPFDRNGMAAYLNADRSALSRELSRMQRDGILEYHKNCFCLLVPFL